MLPARKAIDDEIAVSAPHCVVTSNDVAVLTKRLNELNEQIARGGTATSSWERDLIWKFLIQPASREVCLGGHASVSINF